jgi:hypothetical protein
MAWILGGLALAAMALLGYRWWTSPERQILAILDASAAAFTHQEPESGLNALAAVAAIQHHLAPDISIEGDAVRISGRPDAITAAARVRAASPMMRVRFFDPRISMADDRSATVSATAEVTTRDASDNEVVEVRQLTAVVARPDDRWVVSSVRAASDREPEP